MRAARLVMADQVLLVSAADDAYAAPASLALITAARSTTLRARCVILADALSAPTSERVRSVFARAGVPIDLHDLPQDAFAALPGHARLHRSTYARLYLSRVGFEGRMLWLDADTVTVDSIDELLTVDLLGCIAGCVQDLAVPFVSSPLGITAWQQLGLPPSLAYFNAGVMSIDASLWSTNRIGERALDFARDHPDEAVLADQGPLNAILAQRWLPLDTRWNVRTQLGYAHQLLDWTVSRRGIRRAQRAAILHFGGGVKPWQPNFPPSPDRTRYLQAWSRWLPDFPPPVSGRNLGWYADRLRGHARTA